jgi:diguanylate cyclase (GGDEF)-like protein
VSAGEERTRARAPGEPGPRPSAAGAALVFVSGEPLLGLRVDLDGEVVLGRDPGCAVRLPSAEVSRRHARVTPDGRGGHVVADLRSTNGTLVNGERVGEVRTLAPGDRIALGPFTARYVAAGDEEGGELAAIAGLARTDALTGLPNRRAFDEALDREVARAERAGAPLAVLALDLDRFKAVNDRWGHAAGDAALVAAAARARGALREGDLLARVGGEELAALLPGAGLEAAREAGERVRAAIASAPVQADGASFAVTVSVGVAALAPGERGAALLARADERLYAAKRGGRDRVEG